MAGVGRPGVRRQAERPAQCARSPFHGLTLAHRQVAFRASHGDGAPRIPAAGARSDALPVTAAGAGEGWGASISNRIDGTAPAHGPVDRRPSNAERTALRRVAGVAADGGPTEALFGAVTTEAAALTGCPLLALAKFEDDLDHGTIVAQTGDHIAVGVRFAVTGTSIAARMVRSGRAERIDDYTGVDGAEVVIDRGHRAAVAVPLVVGGNLWGLLGASSTVGPLPRGTENRLTLLAEVAAAAIASVEARDRLRTLADEQAALLRVAALVAGGATESVVFQAVATEAAGLVGDEATTLVRYEGGRTFTVLAERNGPAAVGVRYTIPEDDEGTSAEVLRTLRPARRDSHADIADRSYSLREFDVGSSVSIPIIVEGRLWGCLGTLTEGRRLPSGTEQRLVKFAELISVTIANVQARTQLQRYGREQASRRRVAELVARGAALPEVFDAVAFEASTLLGGLPANLARYDDVRTCTAVSESGGGVPVGSPVRWDPAVPTEVAVPVVVEDRVWGVLSTVTSGHPPPPDAEERLAELAELAAAAIANAENREKLRASRARVVATADETRHRLQRDVHDGAQQRLVQTVLTLRMALDAADEGEDAVGLVGEALQHAESATTQLRDIVHGILPASVTRGGLRAGLETLIADHTLPVRLDISRYPSGRLPGDVEVAAYFVVNEALTNVVKHAQAGEARVTVAAGTEALTVDVRDDGVGGATFGGGSGLVGLTDRVEAMNGSLAVSSPRGGGTTVHATLPIRWTAGSGPAAAAPPGST
ncbi:sensor histidine kinase [Actinomycetospora sp. CA-053990]|uniref:sensor histidine kinase n=1 Tax=Actinomycetospora sp. CA-053990 TaxID=3239891 RepID=UPI003D903A93